mgnify:CR=1 FL=1
MKNKLTLTLLLACVSVCAYAQDVAKLTERIIKLEQKFLWLGIGTVAALIGMATLLYRKMSGIIQERADQLLEKKFAEHPVFARYEREQAVKRTGIIIVGQTAKDKDLVDYLEQDGYTKTDSFAIDQVTDIDVNKYKLLLFNDESGALQQAQMDVLANRYNGQIKLFYYTAANKRFENRQVKMSSFANSKPTLVKRLLEALTN